ncbi:hypothetical protein PtB15_9B275 [Puccinia triticina]|nr:hypothetical protein PtB15_9B275 [Puccinia triticina]
MSGNWSVSHSDLPFAFYRAYHRQLATYLRPQARPVVHPSTLISMPGFLLVSASFMDKCDSLVHRSLRSVTTLGPTTSSFNAGESANLAMGAKPKVLELAHRWLVSTALDIFFGGLLSLWIRAITKRTSMWNTRSVFLLLDFLDGLLYTVLYTAPAPPLLLNDLPSPPVLVRLSLALFNLPFILDVLAGSSSPLTTQPETLKALCLDLLLDPLVFQHLFLHWNSGVRGYYMRLLVWRLSRLNAAAAGPRTLKARDVVKIILAFNARLDAIRKRHNQLSPVSEFLGSQEEEDRRRRRVFSISHTLPTNGLKAELMTRSKYDVSGGLMADKDHTCVRLMYRADFSRKLTYGKTYAIEGFLVGAKRHEMPFIMFDINNTREVPTTHAGGETRVHSLGVIVQTLHSKSSLGLQGPISLIIRHDGVDENDPENDSMLVNYVVPSKIIPDDEVILLSAGKRVLFRGTLAGWNRELDMMRVEVTSGDLDIQDEESYSD